MAKKDYNLEFKPAQKKRSQNVKRFLIGFFALVFLVAVISVVAMQRSGLLDQIFAQLVNPTEPTTETVENGAWNHTGKSVFLLSETDDTGNELCFAALVQVDLETKKCAVTPLSPNASAPLDGASVTLREAMRGGVKTLARAAQALTQTNIDRYISSRDENFVKAINTMGSVTVESDKVVQYHGDGFSLNLAKGEQRLQGDMLLRYFRYLATQKDGARAQAQLLCRSIQTYLTPSLGTDANLLEKRFSAMVNLMETDVTAVDLMNNMTVLQDFLAHADEIAFLVLDTPDEIAQ
ncbi:MAG: LCP family protein [Oscillospiraceae bacterium]|jgi:anionic cell wall polymer biosynthesis LytR-Cps2A-Psr (LCP) family protein|nr:LCP family protein [Oscillospiraceae bacterium]